ncbi:putative uroporphyrinogen decarboxylase [Cyclospora cayetanensis]|uniref:Uroporphyrinogen decarboxylase n=1 Tax=Cyclospora cayetanensis TaxID=88456 RepID=A0A1D3CY47_9EIME|nr:putative uroporphyrinogen decarboxylase [Cyclospora cayetanensis]
MPLPQCRRGHAADAALCFTTGFLEEAVILLEWGPLEKAACRSVARANASGAAAASAECTTDDGPFSLRSAMEDMRQTTCLPQADGGGSSCYSKWKQQTADVASFSAATAASPCSAPAIQLLLSLAALTLCTLLQQQPARCYTAGGGWGPRSLTGGLVLTAKPYCSGSNNAPAFGASRGCNNSLYMEKPVLPLSAGTEIPEALGASLLQSDMAAEEVPPETTEEVKQQIRTRRLANPLLASRPLQNDALRVALMGPEAYAALVANAPSSAKGPQKDSPPHLDTFAVPVWVMRQAGRYLPEFRAVCRDPLLAAEVTLQPLRRFHQLDAVIIFSDILVLPERYLKPPSLRQLPEASHRRSEKGRFIAFHIWVVATLQAMGMPLSVEGAGPRFDWRLQSPADIRRLDTTFNVEDKLGYIFDAIFATVEKLEGRVPLIGFCGAPLTLLCYMVEGRSSANGWRSCKEFLFAYPEESLLLLQQIAALAAQYLIKQVDAGAQVLQVFDTSAGFFSPEQYKRFGVPFMTQIAEEVSAARPGVPLIAFPKDQPLDAFAGSAFSAVSLGWGSERAVAKARFQQGTPLGMRPPLDDVGVKALQGNLDPSILYAPDEVLKQQTAEMVRSFQPGRYVANLGHGMEPQMDPAKLALFLQTVKNTAAEIKKDLPSAESQRGQGDPHLSKRVSLDSPEEFATGLLK